MDPIKRTYVYMHVIVHDSTSEQQQKLNIKSVSNVAVVLVCIHFGQAVVIHWQPSLYLPHIL